MAGSYNAIATADVLLVPKFENLTGTIQKELNGAQPAVKKSADKSSASFVQSFGDGIKGVASSIGQQFSALGGLVKGVGTAAAMTVAAVAVTGGFNRALQIDTARKSMLGLLGDTEKVDDVMKAAQASVKGTAFGLGEAARVASTFAASGITSTKMMEDSLKSVANVAAVSGRSFTDIGTIYTSVMARGKLMGDDMLQLTSSGIPVLSLLAKKLGVTQEAVSEMVSAGEIDFQTFSDAMREGLGDAAAASGDTFNGAISNVRAALSRLTEPVFTAGIGAVTDACKALIPFIDGIGKSFDGLGQAVGPITAMLIAFSASALGPVISQLPIIGPLLGEAGAGLTALASPVGIVIAAFVGLVAVCPELQEALGNLFSAIGNVASTIGDVLSPLFGEIQGSADSLVGSLGALAADGINALADAINSGIGPAMELMGTVFESVADEMTTVFGPVLSEVVEMLRALGDFVVSTFSPSLQALVESFSTFGSDLMGTVAPALEPIVPAMEALGESAAKLADTVGGYLSVALTALSPVLESVANFLAVSIEPILVEVAGVVTNVFGVAFTTVAGVVSGAMQAIGGVIDVVCGTIQTIVGVFVGVFTGDWSMAADGASTAVTGMASTITGVMSALLSAIGGILNAIATIFSGVFNTVSTIVSGVFSGIASTISDRIGDAKNTVSAGLNAISGFFKGLHLELPHINLPHFSIEGSFSIVPPSVPHLSVDWYAKGGMVNSPTVLSVAGEAGPEFVWPSYEPYMSRYAAAIAGHISSGDTFNVGTITIDANDLKDMTQLQDFVGAFEAAVRRG